MNNYDLIIVGKPGPGRYFTALELLQQKRKTTGPRICLLKRANR